MSCWDADATSPGDYFVVGPTFVLEGPSGSAPDTLTLRAAERPGVREATLRAALHGDRAIVVDRPAGSALSASDVVELLRLFARVCLDFWAYRLPLEVRGIAGLRGRGFAGSADRIEAASDPAIAAALAADGFEEDDGVWRRGPAPFARIGAKAATMEEVYQDLFSVPWNFVPRERDVYGPLIAGAPPGPLSVLDLGCGLGKNSGPLESRGFAVYGIDPAAGAVRRCRAVVERPERFIVASGAALPWRDASFDRVLDVGSLHCMDEEERRQAVAEIARVLAPRGALYSRFFTPRPRRWLQLQPMQVDRFGLGADEVERLLSAHLVCESIAERGPVIYAKAVKAA